MISLYLILMIDPLNDVGYTKSDIESSILNKYVCIQFIRGCCNDTKDIFGRNRHINYREDKIGIGIFLWNNKSIVVSEYKGVMNTHSVNMIQF